MGGMMNEQWEKYGLWLYLELEKGIEWPLFYPKFFCLLTNYLLYDQYHRRAVEK